MTPASAETPHALGLLGHWGAGIGWRGGAAPSLTTN
jgi:hypothetical protein